MVVNGQATGFQYDKAIIRSKKERSCSLIVNRGGEEIVLLMTDTAGHLGFNFNPRSEHLHFLKKRKSSTGRRKHLQRILPRFKNHQGVRYFFKILSDKVRGFQVGSNHVRKHFRRIFIGSSSRKHSFPIANPCVYEPCFQSLLLTVGHVMFLPKWLWASLLLTKSLNMQVIGIVFLLGLMVLHLEMTSLETLQ